MNSILSFVAVALLVIGLIGNGFEMRKIRLSVTKDEELTSKNVFLNKNNWKWYALIVVALILWIIANNTNGSI
jgi:Na+/melibiose symporter-like transporter